MNNAKLSLYEPSSGLIEVICLMSVQDAQSLRLGAPVWG